MNLVASTAEPSTSDDTPDELPRTTKELADDELKDSGFLLSVPDPDEWLYTLLIGKALAKSRFEGAQDPEVVVNIGTLLTMIEDNFIRPYVDTIEEKTSATSRGWLMKIAEACRQKFKQLMLDRRMELNERKLEREGDKGAYTIRVVRHLMAMANLTAANAAIKRLRQEIEKWDRLLKAEEDADIVVASVNSPRASSLIP